MQASKSIKTHIPLWLILMVMLQATGPLSIDMYLPSFPEIASEFGIGQHRVELSISFYLLGLSVTQLFFGPLTDRYGRKKPMLFGIFVYLISTVICIFAKNFELFLIARLFQAIGASAGVVIPRATIRDRLNLAQAALAFSLLMLITSIAPIISPLLGTFLAPVIGWRGLFIILLAYGVLNFILISLFFGESLPPEKRNKMELKAIFSNYFQLAKHRHFICFTLSSSLCFAAMFAFISSSATIFMEVYGVAQNYFTYFFMINAIGLMIGSQICSRLLRLSTPYKILKKATLGIMLSLLVGVLISLSGWLVLTLFCLLLLCFSTCLGCIAPTATALAMQEQGHRSGTASAFMGCLQFLLGTLTSIIVSSWQTNSALPLVATMFVAVFIAFISAWFIAKPQITTLRR